MEESESQLGMNKTGTQMSPIQTKKMIEGVDLFTTETLTATPTYLELRQSIIRETGEIGSVPMPASFTGAVEAASGVLEGIRPQVLIDKLGERLAFERTGVRLYDGLITKCEAFESPIPLEELVQFRSEELLHYELVRECMEDLGADPTAQTPCADLTGVESMGLVQVIADPRTSIVQSLHALQVAELVDNDGWNLLIALAEDMNRSELVEKFRQASEEEQNHLRRVREWVEELTLDKARLTH